MTIDFRAFFVVVIVVVVCLFCFIDAKYLSKIRSLESMDVADNPNISFNWGLSCFLQ